jgi:hypothetical protein
MFRPYFAFRPEPGTCDRADAPVPYDRAVHGAHRSQTLFTVAIYHALGIYLIFSLRKQGTTRVLIYGCGLIPAQVVSTFRAIV